MKRGEVIAGRFWVKHCVHRAAGTGVYAAVDLRDSTSVRLRTYSNVTTRGIEHFETVVRRLASLETSFVERVRDFGATPEGDLYAATLSPAGTALDRLMLNPINPIRKGIIARRALEAVAGLHALELTHGQLHPRSMLVTDDEAATVSLIDLMLVPPSQIAADASMPSLTADVAGHVPPEQLRGVAGPFGSADIFSLGSILFELVASQPPFRTDSLVGTFLKILYEEPPVFTLHPSTAGLTMLLRKMLDKEPSARPPLKEIVRMMRGEAVSSDDGDEAPTIYSSSGSVGLVFWERPYVSASSLVDEEGFGELERKIGGTIVKVEVSGRSTLIAELRSSQGSSMLSRAARAAMLLLTELPDSSFVVSLGGRTGVEQAVELLKKVPRGTVGIPPEHMRALEREYEIQEMNGVLTVWEREGHATLITREHVAPTVEPLSTLELDAADLMLVSTNELSALDPSTAALLEPLPTLEMDMSRLADASRAHSFSSEITDADHSGPSTVTVSRRV